MAIIDDGITNQTQINQNKHTAIEYDYYYEFPDTDDGVPDTHGDKIFRSALNVSRAYDVVDLKVADAALGDITNIYVEQALRDILASPEIKIGAINMSFGSELYPNEFADEIAQLAAIGVLSVVAAGNDGRSSTIESPLYPAALPYVISVGSHDGAGNPSDFSQNGPGVDILGDGEDMPARGIDGTSFATPRVAATVTHAQAIVHGLTGGLLNVDQMVDVLQQGGAGPKSKPDPADGHTRYFLHDHNGSLDYAWAHYGGSPARALEYVASYPDLMAAIGANAEGGRLHFEHQGSIEERGISFDGLNYIASYGDLISAFGANAGAGARHYIVAGFREGRSTTFDGLDYIASYGDLISAFGTNEAAAAPHFITSGVREGRSIGFDGLDYIASYRDLIIALGADEAAGASHFITAGFRELRSRDEFDERQYLANYADLRAAFGDDAEAATRHYITNGWAEGRTDEPSAAAASDFLL